MAYMNQEKKKALMPEIKRVLDKYGVKATFRVVHHSSLRCIIRSGKLDLVNAAHSGELEDLDGYIQVNHFWIDEQFSGTAARFLHELKEAMMRGNHDRSDLMTDYFDVGWYIDISIGEWDKPYVLTA